MQYEWSDRAGYYGTGSWIVFSFDCYGHKCVWNVFATEQDCIDAGAKPAKCRMEVR